MDQSVIPEVEAPLDDPLMGQLVIPEVEPLMGQLVIPEIQPSMGQSVIPEVEAPLDEPSMGQSVIPQVEAPLDKPLMGQSVIPQVEPSMGQSVIPEVEPLMGQLVIPEVDPSMGQLIILDVQPLVDKPLVRQSVIPQVEPLMGQLVILDVQPPVDKPLVSQSVIPEVEPKRSLKGRRTFEIGRHFRGASLRTVPKNVQRSPASRSTADDMENGVMCSSSVQPKRFRVGRAKESAILREMSSLASDRLFEPARNAAPLSNRAGPEKYGNKMVPKTFFSTAAKLRPLWIDANSGGVFEKFTSPSWIYLLESAAISVFGISRKTNFTFGSIAAMAPYNTKTVSTKSPWSVAYGSTWRDMRVRPPCEFPFHVAPLCADLDAVKDGRCAIARHHALGLQTVMALLFPGCWRLLARKRRQPKRFVSVRRLTFLRFDGASKDADPSVQFFTSLHSAFDADLPLWDRLDPRSMPPSEICADSATVTAKQPTPRRGFALHNRWGIHFCASLPTSPLIRESARSRLRLSPPEFPQRPSDKPDAAIPAFPESDDTPRQEAESEEKKPKRVSQIRIRKTVPKPDPNLTPMGLPRPKRCAVRHFGMEIVTD
ncbi:protein PRR14L-like, partial [Sceloporus undulatus]|uniref:protein PRR14L-like n=1 Tax=Sceloporus undulatus TaxID=8520 RepID=UPI001C4AFC05